MKLKMMEIAFEQVNNSRNDLMEQLANRELSLEDLKKIWFTKPDHWVEKMYELLK